MTKIPAISTASRTSDTCDDRMAFVLAPRNAAGLTPAESRPAKRQSMLLRRAKERVPTIPVQSTLHVTVAIATWMS